MDKANGECILVIEHSTETLSGYIQDLKAIPEKFIKVNKSLRVTFDSMLLKILSEERYFVS